MRIFAKKVSGLRPLKSEERAARMRERPAVVAKRAWLRLIIILILLSVLAALTQRYMDERLFPQAAKLAEVRGQAAVNASIDRSVQNIILSSGLTAHDFYTVTTGEGGRVNSITVNTVLLNRISAAFASELSRQLSEIPPQRVSVPSGALFGVRLLANVGPPYSVEVLPIADMSVDYETSFTSAGINQTQFQVWLTVRCEMRIANPPMESTVVIERKVAVVNTVFSGEVPSWMLDTR